MGFMKTWLPVCFSQNILQGPAKGVVTWRDEERVGNMGRESGEA